jgi:hypothetical protein
MLSITVFLIVRQARDSLIGLIAEKRAGDA